MGNTSTSSSASDPGVPVPQRLRGKVALVTGAAQGIGLGIALRLAQEGATVAMNVHHSDQRARDALQELTAAGARCGLFLADVSDTKEAQDLIDNVHAAFGQVDVLVNNAGIERREAALDLSAEQWDAVLHTNLKAPFFLSQAFARLAQREGRGGRIVNISSVHEELPFPHFAAYCASKGGLKMIMRTLALELAPLGITVNNVAPGAIRTPINSALLANQQQLEALIGNIPLRRLGDPSDVAGAVAFLASEDARYITGTSIVVDGGLLWNYEEQ